MPELRVIDGGRPVEEQPDYDDDEEFEFEAWGSRPPPRAVGDTWPEGAWLGLSLIFLILAVFAGLTYLALR